MAGLVVSTLNLSNADFLAGRYNFTAHAGAGGIENQGSLTALPGGQIYLVAPNLSNSGMITSPNGDIILAAGNSVELVNASSPDMRVVIDAPNNQVLNLGSIVANSGRIGIYAGLINHHGIVSADSATLQGGKIVFKATKGVTLEAGSTTTANGPQGGSITIQSDTGTTLVAGNVAATGDQGRGGEVQVLGNLVGMIGNASIDASGQTGGGSVLIGGDRHGDNLTVQNAWRTYFGLDATVKADAIQSGDGGKVIVWSDDITRFYGRITARGGTSSGNGGFVEVSGKNNLDFAGLVNAGASNGLAGTLLLDPRDITVVKDSTGTNDSQVSNVPTYDGSVLFGDGSTNASFTVSEVVLEGLTGSIVLQATRDITINAGLSGGGLVLPYQTGFYRVVLQAGRHITINSPLITNGAPIWLEADSPHVNGYTGTPPPTSGADGAGAVRINAAVSSTGGKITLLAGSNAKGGTNGGGFDLNADVNAGAGGIDAALSTQSTGQLNFFIGSAGQAQFTSTDTGRLLSTGQLRIGQATTAGTDGLGANAVTIRVDSLGVGTSGGPVTLASTAGSSVVFTSGTGGISIDRALTTNQATTIATAGALTINSALNTSGNSLTINAASVSGANNINTGGGTFTCTGTGCPGGTVITWDGGGNNLDWFTAANWSGNVLPTSSDDVQILSSAGTILVSGNNAFAKSLIAYVPLDIQNTGSLSLSNASQLTRSFTLSGTGSLLGTGAVAVNGSSGVLTWSGGTMGTGGTFTLGVGSTGTFSGSLTLNRSFQNSGALTLGSGVLGATINGTGSIANASTITVASGTSNAINVALSNPANSLIQFLGSLATTNFPTNSGTISIATGATLSNPTGFTNTGTLSGSGTIVVGTGVSKLVNQGNINPGGTGTTGTLAVTGDMQLSTGSNLNMELGGTGAGQYDVLAVSGALSGNAGSFGGLSLSRINGYTYVNVNGDTFPLITAASGTNTGIFAPFTLARTNLTPTYASTNFTLSAAPMVLIVSADALSKVYGAVDPTLTYTATGFDATTGDTAATALSGLLGRATGTNVGAYSINQGTLASPLGYAINIAPVNFSITPAALTVTANNASRTYGAANPTFTDTISGYVNGENAITAGVTGASALSTAAINTTGVGTATITTGVGTLAAGNYTFSNLVNGTLTITPAALTVTANNASRTYGAANPIFTDTISGYVNGENAITAGVTGASALSTAATNTTGVGTATITTGVGTLAAGNYTFSNLVNGTLTITPAALTVTANNAAKTYGQTTTFAGTEFTSSALQNSETIGSVSLASTGAASTAGVAGSPYAITVSGATSGTFNAGNYTISYVNGALTVNRAALTVTANNNGKVFNDIEPNLYTTGVNYSGFVNGETPTVLSGTLSLVRVAGEAAGSYNINASGLTSTNYSITYPPGVFTISPAGQLLIVMANGSAVYGVAPATLLFVPVYAKYTTGGGATDLLTGVTPPANNSWTLNDGVTSFTAGTNYLLGGNVGNYSINTGPVSSTNINFGANIVTTAGTLSITPRPVTLVAPTTPTKGYDGTNVLAMTSSTVGISNRVGSDIVNITGSGSTYANKNAGTGKGYTLNNLALTGAAAGNYSLAVSSLSGTDGVIIPAALTVSATGVNRTYDGSMAATVTLSDNRISGDVLSDAYGSAAFADKNVGAAKTVNVSGISISGTDASNYTLSNTTASTTADIAQAPLTISAVTASKQYDGTTSATGTPTVTGTVYGGDTLTGQSQSFASKNVLGLNGSTLNAGYTLNDGNSGNNYAVTLATAPGTITTAPLTISATGVNRAYDGSMAATVTLSDNRISGDVLSDAYGSAAFADKNVGAAKTVNVSGISISGTDASNYTLSNTTASTMANITPAVLSLSGTRPYDATTAFVAAAFGTSGTISGVIGETLTLTGAGSVASPQVGSYAVNATGLTLGNGTGLASNYTLTGGTHTGTIISPANTEQLVNTQIIQLNNLNNALISSSVLNPVNQIGSAGLLATSVYLEIPTGQTMPLSPMLNIDSGVYINIDTGKTTFIQAGATLEPGIYFNQATNTVLVVTLDQNTGQTVILSGLAFEFQVTAGAKVVRRELNACR
ncbi:MAG TPA: MBG domain-containing protein [Gallionella sp.]|nr:MBG domain-containing protein [Gallionella sp.]